jgi:alginate O-acetyltransferase complex protein AlgI
MQHPLRATTLADFWGRWNRAFRDLAFRLIFRPLHRRIGVASATLATFGFSGLVHDLVISVPARGGYGLPTLYFLIQGIGIVFEKSAIGRRTHPLILRALLYVTLLAPLGLLLHSAFVYRVVVPFLIAIGRCL